MEQLPLDLGTLAAPPETVLSRCNEAAYAMVEAHPRWPHPIAIVTGPEGSGKSHLARAFAEATRGRLVEGRALRSGAVLALAEAVVVVDDADRADERALFHLINAVRGSGTSALLTMGSRANVALSDLASRLRAVPEVALDPPDDALLRRVIMERFQQRQLPAEPAVVALMMGRMERTLHDAVRLVDEIDRLGLAERRGPTRPLAARVLKSDPGSRCA